MSGVNVTLTNEATGVQQTTKTNNTGLYSFPFVLVGNYTLAFEHPRFQKTDVNHIPVHIGQTTAQDARLKVGSTQESVTVSATAPLVRPTDSSISSVVNEKLIDELPLSGRRFTDFVLLTPTPMLTVNLDLSA